jgi:hypothetical protein
LIPLIAAMAAQSMRAAQARLATAAAIRCAREPSPADGRFINDALPMGCRCVTILGNGGEEKP